MDSNASPYIRASQITLGSLSCFLDFLIIIFFIRAKLKRKATIGFELVCYLSICNFIKEVVYILHWENRNDKLSHINKNLINNVDMNYINKTLTNHTNITMLQPEYMECNNNTNNINEIMDNRTNSYFLKNLFFISDNKYNYTKNPSMLLNIDYEYQQNITHNHNKNINTHDAYLPLFGDLKIKKNNYSFKAEYDNSTQDTSTISNICIAQGAFMLYSDLSQYSVAAIISLYTLLTIKQTQNVLTLKKRLFIYLIGYIFPLTVAILSILLDKIGPNIYWCWIKTSEKDYMLLNYFFVWFFIFFNISVSFKILRFNTKSYWHLDQAQHNNSYSKKIIVYPLISMIFWFFYTVNRFIQGYLIDSLQTRYITSVIIIYLNNIEGLLYSIIAANGIQIGKKIKKIFTRLMVNCQRKETDDLNKSSALKYEDLLNDTKSKAETNL